MILSELTNQITMLCKQTSAVTLKYAPNYDKLTRRISVYNVR